MTDHPHNQTPQAYGRVSQAQDYDDRIRRAIPIYDLMHDLTPVLLAPALGQGGKVLVVGSGTGNECIALADHFTDILIFGVDPALAMIEQAGAKIAQRGLSGRITLTCGYVSDLDKTGFDAVTCLLVMHYVEGKAAKLALLKDIAARLRTGGILWLADLFGPAWDHPDQQDFIARWIAWQEAQGFGTAEIEAGLKHAVKNIHPIPLDELTELLVEAGFSPPKLQAQALHLAGWTATKL